MRRILMIAFHFPPLFGSSGIQRALSFASFLHQSESWQPVILTATEGAYEETSPDQLDDIPPGLPVHRAMALDSARQLSFKGRYLSAMAIPDRWVSWYPFAVAKGLRLIAKYRPDAIWSTYPIATSHMIAATLQKYSRLPWICDFRDPMVEYVSRTSQWYPTDSRLRNRRLRIEKNCVERASQLVFCTDGARDIYLDRYDELKKSNTAVIPNGYDERIFAEVEHDLKRSAATDSQYIRLVHSGTLYPGSDRDPSCFFRALHILKKRGVFTDYRVQVVLRASAYDSTYQSIIQELQLDDVVTLAPAIPYREALAEMLDADGLLLFQGYTSNPAIPAKLYEYLRARKPLFAMVDGAGDTAGLLHDLEYGELAPLDDERRLTEELDAFLTKLRAGHSQRLGDVTLRSLSRDARANELLTLLDSILN